MISKFRIYGVIYTSLIIKFSYSMLFLFLRSGTCQKHESPGGALPSSSSEQIFDTSFPIIFEYKGNELNSTVYFGYTVSLSEGKPRPDKLSQDPDGWIFIGAPKSNAGPDMYNNSVEPGVIWRCSLGRRFGYDDSCEMVNIDPATSGTSGQRPKGSPMIESHNGAWVGASMEINNDHLVTCGMRWSRGIKYFNGICYWFADFSVTKRSSYKSHSLANLVDRNLYDQRLMPFFQGSPSRLEPDKYFYFNNSKGEISSAHEWQLGQAGISAHLFKDPSLGPNTSLLIGAPGVREWSGAVVLYTNPITRNFNMTRKNRNKDDPTFAEYTVLNRAPIVSGSGRDTRNFWNEYFGYDVTSGRYQQKDKVLYASGAPRAHHSGEVVIFDYPPYIVGSSTYKRDIVPVIQIQAPVNSFASYFGSVLHSADFDGDGLDELVVGAPLYTISLGPRDTHIPKDGTKKGQQEGRPEKIKREIPNLTEEQGDQGCVIVYTFKADGKVSSKPQEMGLLVGSKVSRSRFGSAISSMTFSFKNGSKETYLIVGAPYEPLEDSSSSSGAVYIYSLNKALGKFSNFIQRITAASIGSSLKGFGISLCKPKDVDENHTPDLAIGSYNSDAAVVLRTRPRILLRGFLQFLSMESQEISEVRKGSQRFFLRSCFSVQENLGIVDNMLDIWVKVRFDDNTIHFHEDHVNARVGNTRNEIIYMRNVVAHRRDNCENLTVIADHKDGVGNNGSDFSGSLRPFRFHQEVKYNETLNQPIQIRQVFANTANKPRQSVGFSSFGARKPASQIFRNKTDLAISLKECRDPVCRPNVSISWQFLNESDAPIPFFIIGSEKEVTLRINLTNTGETAENPHIKVEWNYTEITESTLGGRWLNKNCKNSSEGGHSAFTSCNLGRYFRKGRSFIFDIEFNMANIFMDEPKNKNFVVDGSVTFEDDHIPEVKGQGELSLDYPETLVVVELMGSRENDSTLRSPLKYKTSQLQHIDLPKEDKNGVESYREISLYSSFRQRFTIEVKQVSVSQVKAVFKIPLYHEALDTHEPLILVKTPHINADSSESVQCRAVTHRLNFHSIQLLEDISIYGKSKELNFNLDQDTSSFGHSVNSYLTPTDHHDFQSGIMRTRRDVQNVSGNVSDTESTPTTTEATLEIAIDMKPPSKVSKQKKLEASGNALKLICESEGDRDCLEVHCEITNLRANTHIHIPFELYPVKENVDKVLKSTQKTSLFIETSGYATIFHGMGESYKDNDVAQTVLIKISVKQVELWVYIAAGACGVILLALIIMGLYKCGFFKREKRQQLNQMKAEQKRKSMLASTRQSVMQSSGGSMMGIVEEDFESQQNLLLCSLTEVEHPTAYEDTELERKTSLNPN